MAVAALKDGLQQISMASTCFFEALGYHDYEGVSVHLDERERLLQSLGDATAMILRNHGLLAVGRTVPEAFGRLYRLERACQVQLDAAAAVMSATLIHEAKAYERTGPTKEDILCFDRKTFDLYCHMLARSLAQVVNIVDPHVIVLGGGLSKIDRLYPRLSDLIARYTFSGSCKTPILAPVGGDASGVRGAAWLWLDA